MPLSFVSVNRLLMTAMLFSAAVLSTAAFSADTGGFSLGSTRVIYDAAKNQATVTVVNSAKNSPFLAQSWVDMYQLVVSNPTPYYVTFSSLKTGGKDIKDTSVMVPPLGEARYALPSGVQGNQVSFKALNDFGGLFPERTVHF